MPVTGQKLVVQRGLQYLDGLAAESQGDPTLQSELATAHESIRDIQQSIVRTSLQDTAGRNRKAIAHCEQLLTQDRSAKVINLATGSYQGLGQTQTIRGGGDFGRAALMRAVELSREEM